jgi:hypothetical protein
MRRRWIIPFVALALLMPVGALAVGGGGSEGLNIEASLERCGVAGDTVICELDVNFDRIDEGEYYTATVTRPDSTVQSFGSVASGGSDRAAAELWVPYAGNGSYVVEITAWGYDEEGRPEEITSESGESKASGEGTPKRERPGRSDPVELPGTKPDRERGGAQAGPTELSEPALLPECEPAGGEAGADEGAGGAQEAGSGETGTAEEQDGDAAEAGGIDPASEATSDSGPTLDACEEPIEDDSGPCCPPDA